LSQREKKAEPGHAASRGGGMKESLWLLKSSFRFFLLWEKKQRRGCKKLRGGGGGLGSAVKRHAFKIHAGQLFNQKTAVEIKKAPR